MAVYPAVVDRLLVLLPTLPGWAGVQVYDGAPVTADVPLEYVAVGYVEGEDFAGTFEQEPHPGRPQDIERGSIRSTLAVQSGDVGLSTVRARAFALADAWQTYFKAHRDLEAFPQDFTASLAVDVQPAQNAAGSAQTLICTLTYEACG